MELRGLCVEHASIWSPASEFRVSAFYLVVSPYKRRKIPANQFNQSTDIWGLTRFREHREITRIINTVTYLLAFITEGIFCERGGEEKQGTDNRFSPALVSCPGLRHSLREAASILLHACSCAAQLDCRKIDGGEVWTWPSQRRASKASSVSLRQEDWKENAYSK